MGFWIFYVLPLCISFVLMLLGIHLFKDRVKIGAYLVDFLAGINCTIAGIFAVFYIYSFVLEFITPSTLTRWGWIDFWNDTIAFVIATIILLAINIFVWRRSRRMRLKFE